MTEIPDSTEAIAEVERLRYRNRFIRTLISTVSILIVVAALVVLIAEIWMPVLHIYGSSMSPTLEDGEITVTFRGSSFETGDLVAFYYGNKLLVKRVIAGPGDWINIEKNGDVSVNGKMLEEDYLQDKALGQCDIEFPYQIPEERWFLMGDNRSVSIDSRSSQIGCVGMDQVVGRIFLRVWPLNKLGFTY